MAPVDMAGYEQRDPLPGKPPPSAAIGFAVLSFTLMGFAAAAGVFCVLAVGYRLSHTEGFGLALTPPRFSLGFLDVIAIGTFCVAMTLAIFSACAGREAYVRLTRRDQSWFK